MVCVSLQCARTHKNVITTNMCMTTKDDNAAFSENNSYNIHTTRVGNRSSNNNNDPRTNTLSTNNNYNYYC